MWIEVTDTSGQTFHLNMDQVITVRYRLTSDQTVVITPAGKMIIKGWLRKLSNGSWRIDVRDK